MTFSKKIVAITAVAASGVMGFDMNASAGPDGASASMGGMSVSAGPNGAKFDGTKVDGPTATEFVELLKKEQLACSASITAKLSDGEKLDLGRKMIKEKDYPAECKDWDNCYRNCDWAWDKCRPAILAAADKAAKETCLKPLGSRHTAFCSADSETDGYLKHFGCDDAITVCTAAGVAAESMPQCMTSGAIAGTVISVLLVLAIISGAAYYFLVLKKKQQKNANAEIDIEKGSSTVTVKVAARRENGSTILTLNVDGNEPQKVCVQDDGSNTTCETEKVSK